MGEGEGTAAAGVSGGDGDVSRGRAGGGSSSAGTPANPDAEFLQIVARYPKAVDLLAAYAREADPPLLLRLYLASGRLLEAGHCVLKGKTVYWV